MIPLSILELCPVSAGFSSGQALRNSLELAALGERLGYTRIWFAEHHNLASIASTTTEILIAAAAARTTTIQVGSGGVMLPNHAPLKVAESYKMLEALHPGRINLGLGRAPGTDLDTALLLRRAARNAFDEPDFPAMLSELRGFGSQLAFGKTVAYPTDVCLPPIWLLGSGTFSAIAAAELGLGFSFAAHFSPDPPGPAMLGYRSGFRPSENFPHPHAILAVSVLCAESQTEADRQATTMDVTFVQLGTSRPAPLLPPEEAAVYPFTPEQRRLAAASRALRIIGTPDSVKARLERMAADTQADEIIVTTFMHGHAERMRSFELLAEAWGLQARP